jgi:hypothetical protein
VYVADSGNGTIRKITSGGVVTTLAGSPGGSGGILESVGNGDGTGAAAQITNPFGIAVDGSGNVYFTDDSGLRMMTPAGAVTTLHVGFSPDSGIAVDANGNVFVADSGNHIVEEFSAAGVLTTLPATFSSPSGIGVDGSGNVFIADSAADTIQMISASGVLSTVAGKYLYDASEGFGIDGLGTAARFNYPSGLAVKNGLVYVADTVNNSIRVGAPNGPPPIPTEPAFSLPLASQTVALGSTLALSVASATVPTPSYQWFLGGVPIPGATDSTLLVSHLTAADSGEYYCVATNALGTATITANVNLVSTADPGRLINLSCRSFAGTGANVLVAGFVVGGSGTTGSLPLLVRASGPALAPFDIANTLADPELLITDFNSRATLATNSGWNGSLLIALAAAEVGAFQWLDGSSHDSALLQALPGGTYTATVEGSSGDSGVALVELYDATLPGMYSPSNPRLTNISARTLVGNGSNVLIAGFAIGGDTSETILIRASGPALAQFGIFDVLPDPQLQLNDASGIIATNDGWEADPQIAAVSASQGAFPWGPSHDSAILVTLAPGSYTAVLSGASGDTGIALIEVYEVR